MSTNQERVINFMSKLSTTDIKDFIKLLGLHITVQAKNFFEYLKVIAKYYPNWTFFKTDIGLQLIYLFDNPFTISKRFLIKKGEEDTYAYGETPLTTFETIAKECRIKPTDTLYELGCGRGRICFWAHSFLKCKAIGIDYIPEFVSRANRITRRLNLKDIHFRQENMIDTQFSDGTVFYLYGTCLEDPFIEKLAAKLALLPSGTKIITISYPLTDYNDKFIVMKRFPASFNWGIADVYLQVTS